MNLSRWKLYYWCLQYVILCQWYCHLPHLAVVQETRRITTIIILPTVPVFSNKTLCMIEKQLSCTFATPHLWFYTVYPCQQPHYLPVTQWLISAMYKSSVPGHDGTYHSIHHQTRWIYWLNHNFKYKYIYSIHHYTHMDKTLKRYFNWETSHPISSHPVHSTSTISVKISSTYSISSMMILVGNGLACPIVNFRTHLRT